VVVVVEALDDRGEVPGVRGLAAGLEAAAAGLAVRRELRRCAVDETGEDGHPLLVRGSQEGQTGRIGLLLLGGSSGRVHPDAAAADVVAIARQGNPPPGKEQVVDVSLHPGREPHEIVRPPRPRGSEAVDPLCGCRIDARHGEILLRGDRGDGRRRRACNVHRRARRNKCHDRARQNNSAHRAGSYRDCDRVRVRERGSASCPDDRRRDRDRQAALVDSRAPRR
jgi:hypothetical protein